MRALELKVSPILEGLSLQPDDDWAARMVIKKKKQGNTANSPVEYHFSEDELSLAKKAQERWQSVRRLLAVEPSFARRRGGGRGLPGQHVRPRLFPCPRGDPRAALRQGRRRAASGARRLRHRAEPDPELRGGAAAPLVPCGLAALRRNLHRARRRRAGRRGRRRLLSARFPQHEAVLKRSLRPASRPTRQVAALVALVRSELASSQDSSCSGTLAAQTEALVAKRQEIEPFAQSQPDDGADSDSDEESDDKQPVVDNA